MNRLQERYTNEITKNLMKKFGYESTMQIPKMEKIVINIGVGDAVNNSKFLEEAVEELTLISGQKPIVTTAKKSIAGFKVREGQAIGCKVTLRGERMYEFLDKLVNVSLPRVRDFRGVSNNSFDGRGNYTLGVKEQLIFPEIDFDNVNKVRGMDIVLVTTAQTDEESKEYENNGYNLSLLEICCMADSGLSDRLSAKCAAIYKRISVSLASNTYFTS